MDQGALTVIAPIKRDEVEPLRKLLNVIGDDIKGVADNKYIRFSDIAALHFARWVIVPEEKGYQPQLAFEANYDGRLDDLLEALIEKAGRGLDQIYSKCEGYPSDGTANKAAFKYYFRDRSIKPKAFYIAYRGRSAKEIHNNTRLYRMIEDFLDEQQRQGALNGTSGVEARKKIQEFLRQERVKNPDLATAPVKISSAWRVAGLILAIVVALLILFPFPVFFLPLALSVRALLFLTPLILLGLFLIVLRRREKADEQMKVEFVSVADAIFERENHQVQNQLTHIVEIKPERFRLYTLKAILRIINLAAKLFWYKGSLGSIPTIHFARWVMIDNDRRLLFFSNFDGSWENYLGDFIDKAAVGLTGVWSNTVGFPKTEFLLFKGARDEERFKEWARAKQIPTQAWYSAHPDETVKNILNNIEVRNRIEPTLSERQTEQWLQRF